MKHYTVCAALNERKKELYDALEKNDIAKAKAIAYECLGNPKITDKLAVVTARQAFANPNPSHFTSTLWTYMTCMKA